MKKVTIETHKEHLAPYFKSLNEEWLKRFFVIEPIDQKVLSQPTKLINEGGQILYASIDGMVVGCVALKHHGQGTFELTKMAVTQSHQAHGIGTQLMQSCIDYYQTINGKKLYLESHSSLKPAIKLYQRFGFVAMPTPFESDYQRSDFYMEYIK
ncbi:GNAT family N-acetyltransferase [Marinicella sp. S1101]|uniref:GNAT family N-acetyltransferase n=1 Tax=Marinicella marina TaxID=2996016 RepID=UPI002260C584|nr:GNAT family N-acetyltransferase [Marinicella marina]MCX7553552.1 GNAT family N-acetyltransferase [Marinicella marina]MDJ1140176.1 GNAT family N-acetyltransferase [Marinicella marina]